MSPENAQDRVIAAVDRHGALGIAVSGGVDSMALAYVAHRFSRARIAMFHAVSPAVPPHATMRVQEYAQREQWALTLIDAGEFDDARYVANPVNRCYFCKSNLYARIASSCDTPIASGTNLDDLGDFRPGLAAAAERRVVHPYVEARVDKATLRAMARHHGLHDLAELPAQPCLASRVETGIAIDADDLAFIDRVERAIASLGGDTPVVRCRVTHAGVVVELDGGGGSMAEPATRLAGRMCAESGRTFLGVRPYRRGAAFLVA